MNNKEDLLGLPAKAKVSQCKTNHQTLCKLQVGQGLVEVVVCGSGQAAEVGISYPERNLHTKAEDLKLRTDQVVSSSIQCTQDVAAEKGNSEIIKSGLVKLKMAEVGSLLVVRERMIAKLNIRKIGAVMRIQNLGRQSIMVSKAWKKRLYRLKRDSSC
ncbi:hypothetical protein Tco_1167453 [Tanacetum coccineum]